MLCSTQQQKSLSLEKSLPSETPKIRSIQETQERVDKMVEKKMEKINTEELNNQPLNIIVESQEMK